MSGCFPSKNLALGLTLMLQNNTNYSRGLGREGVGDLEVQRQNGKGGYEGYTDKPFPFLSLRDHAEQVSKLFQWRDSWGVTH